MSKRIGWTLASVVVATSFICPATRAQFDHQDLLTEYAREMTKLPPLVLRTEFRSLTTPETLQARFQEYADERLQELARVPAEQRESFRKELNLPEGPNAIDDFFAERDQATLAYYADLQKTQGVFEFYAGNITEIRRYSSEDEVLRTLQFGVEQPKLLGAKQDVWVIREFNEKQKQTQISSESRVSLPGMLPVDALRGGY